MIEKLLKKYEISLTIILGSLSFVFALIFFGNEFPGKHILFSAIINQSNHSMIKENYYFRSNTQYRITTYMEGRQIPKNINPFLHLKIEQLNIIIIDRNLYSENGRGRLQFNHVRWFNDYGFFKLPSSGHFNILITAKEIPNGLDTFEIIVSEKASSFGGYFFISIGGIIFLILLVRKGNTKVTLK